MAHGLWNIEGNSSQLAFVIIKLVLDIAAAAHGAFLDFPSIHYRDLFEEIKI